VNLSLLVVTFNRPADLLDLLQSVAEQEDATGVLEEMLVLDNGTSVDYTQCWDFVSGHPELPIRVLRSEENIGAAAGKNLLIREARGDSLLFLDDDAVFSTPRDLASAASVLDKELFREANAGIVQLRVVYHDTKQPQISAYPHKRREPTAADTEFLTSFFAGCATLMRKEALDLAELYPEEFSIYMEEYDLGYRVINAGYAIGYDPSVTIEHKESSAGRLADAAKLRQQWVNKSVIAWRYLPRRYFVTTALMWSLEYFRRVQGHPLGYLRGWRDVLQIPFVERRKPIGPKALAYLRMVDARLWY
jgi:GT2 family glycosyltransferase